MIAEKPLAGMWQLEEEVRLSNLADSQIDDGVLFSPGTPSPGENSPGSRLAAFSNAGFVVILVLLAAGVWSDRPLLTVLCALMLAVGMVSSLWASLSHIALDYRCSLSATRAFPDDHVTLTLTLHNRKLLPLGWAMAQELIPRRLAPADVALERVAHPMRGRIGFGTPLGWHEEASWSCRLLCRRRGYYVIGPGRILAGDMFGLFLRSRASASKLPLIVYPRLYALEDLGLPSRQPLGEGRDPAQQYEDTTRPRSLRDYTPDTPLKHVDWPASARHGKWYARTYDRTVTIRTHIFVAVDRFDGLGESALFELGLSSAASIASQLTDQRQPVGLLANGELADALGPVALAAARGTDQLERVLENLARLRRIAAVSFAAMLRTGSDALAGGSTLCVIAARYSEEDAQRLAMLRRRGCAVFAIVIGPAALPENGIPGHRIDIPVAAVSDASVRPS